MKKEIDYEELEQEIFRQQNELRRNPNIFLPKLRDALIFYFFKKLKM